MTPRVTCAGLAPVIAAHDILRLKGFLAVPGKEFRQVVQARRRAARSIISTGRGAPDEARQSRLVVIGRKGLDRAAIAAALAGMSAHASARRQPGHDRRRQRRRRSRPDAGGDRRAVGGRQRDRLPRRGAAPPRRSASRAGRACGSPACCGSATTTRSISMSRRSLARARSSSSCGVLGGRGYWPYGVERAGGAGARARHSAGAAAGRRPARRRAAGALDRAGRGAPSPLALSRRGRARPMPSSSCATPRASSAARPRGASRRRCSTPGSIGRAAAAEPRRHPRRLARRRAGRGDRLLSRAGAGGEHRADRCADRRAGGARPQPAAALRRRASRTRKPPRILADILGRGAARRSCSTAPASPSPRRAPRSARRALEPADCPVLQVIFAGGDEASWREGTRGLDARDIAMNVALPEVDGRIITRALSFKARRARDPLTEARPRRLRSRWPTASPSSPISRATGCGCGETPASERRIALVLANYPHRDGRIGNGVGLDTPQATDRGAARAAGRRLCASRTFPTDGDDLIAPPAARARPTPRAGRRRPAEESFPRSDYARVLREPAARGAGSGQRALGRARARSGLSREPSRLRQLRHPRHPLRQCRRRACSRRAATTSIPRASYHDPGAGAAAWLSRLLCLDRRRLARPRGGAYGQARQSRMAAGQGAWRCRRSAFPRRRWDRCRISIPSSSTIPAKAPRRSAAPRR